MATKKENVADYLKAGKRKVVKELCDEDSTFVKIQTATGTYSFPESYKCSDGTTYDAYKDIQNTIKNMERRIANKQNWGAYGGRAEVCKDNKTCLALADIKNNPLCYQEGPYLKMMQQYASQAPREAAPYLFLNLYDRLGDCGVHLTIQTTYDIVSIMPLAWSKGWEGLNHFADLPLSAELCNLTPKFKVGEVITYHSRQLHEDMKAEVLKVIYKQYRQKPSKNRWGLVEYVGEGPWVVWYHTAYGDFRYDEVKKK